MNDWCEASGLGTFFFEIEGKERGGESIEPAKDESGVVKVVDPEMIVGMLLEMATGQDCRDSCIV